LLIFAAVREERATLFDHGEELLFGRPLSEEKTRFGI
jgi:hypothetical protein